MKTTQTTIDHNASTASVTPTCRSVNHAPCGMTSYSAFDPPSHPPLSVSNLRPWPNNSDSTSDYKSTYSPYHPRDPLHSTLGRSKVTKTTSNHGQAMQQQHFTSHTQAQTRGHGHHIDPFYHKSNSNLKSPSHNYSFDESTSQHHHPFPNPARPESYTSSQSFHRDNHQYPRANRPPTLFDRIKAALQTPSQDPYPYSNQPIQSPQISHSPSHTSALQKQQHAWGFDAHPLPSPDSPDDYHHLRQPFYNYAPSVEPPSPLSIIQSNIQNSEVVKRAYSCQSSEMKSSLSKLQQIDSGKVEYRTIVSRWEPALPAAPPSTSISAEGQTLAQQKPKHDPTKLVSLANYIRHLISLTSGIPSSTPAQTGNSHPRAQEESPHFQQHHHHHHHHHQQQQQQQQQQH
ncbi:hypothetical protein BGZ94_001946 [Podila epigama]|nr:hypothetical protein BGZ94_001946 [Podila epigama]